jgi:very-short-patch-repair endonuclease
MYILSNSENNISCCLQEPIITYARKLRQEQSEAKKLLWSILRGRKFHGYKFRRQHPIARLFIVDFYCCQKKLAIEVDEFYSDEKLKYKLDLDFSKFLDQQGIKVLRFKNEDILNQTDEVLKNILIALGGRIRAKK